MVDPANVYTKLGNECIDRSIAPVGHHHPWLASSFVPPATGNSLKKFRSINGLLVTGFGSLSVPSDAVRLPAQPNYLSDIIPHFMSTTSCRLAVPELKFLLLFVLASPWIHSRRVELLFAHQRAVNEEDDPFEAYSEVYFGTWVDELPVIFILNQDFWPQGKKVRILDRINPDRRVFGSPGRMQIPPKKLPVLYVKIMTQIDTFIDHDCTA